MRHDQLISRGAQSEIQKFRSSEETRMKTKFQSEQERPSFGRSQFLQAMAMALALTQVTPLQAGWSGVMNGVGFGWASVNVTTAGGTAKSLTSTNVSGPGAAMTTTTGYTVTGPLPQGASTNTVARIKGSAGYVWRATTIGSNGDKTDNVELESRVQISPSDCASLTMDSELVPSSFDGHSGTISVKTTGTAGTALWLRGFEYTGDPNLLPVDDPNTPENESIEFLKANGVLKFETLVVGPFEFGNAGRCDLVIPFTLNSGDTNTLFLASDGVAKSNPLKLICPADMMVACDQTVAYPDVGFTGGCGDVNVTYSPASTALHLGENVVTITAVDGKGDTDSCTFKVTKFDSTPPTLTAPADLADVPTDPGSCFASHVVLGLPTAADGCSEVSVSNDAPASFPIGTTLVTWTAKDTTGNKTTAIQKVTVADHTAPVPDLATLPTVTGQCSATIVSAPTATDNCSAKVIGVTTQPLTYSAQGTYTVQWTFTDAYGNSSSQMQTVIVKDTLPPATPVLAAINGQCGSPVVLVPPTTTDNCSGVVTGTTSSPLTFTTPGTFTVTWKFTDAAGNFTTANQTVKVTGARFEGFEYPINGFGGSASSPFKTFNCATKIPIKFELECCGSHIRTGQPTVAIYRLSTNTKIVSANFTLSGDDWCYTWDTAGLQKGGYKVVANLQDGTTREVYLNLK